jgi:hypothetical protein
MDNKAYNVITLTHLTPEWHDRDWVMFHAMFQILVDFVELEHPFTFDFDMTERMTDKGVMLAKVEEMKLQEYVEAHYYYSNIRDEDKLAANIEALNHALRMEELFNLYNWYTSKLYELSDAHYELSAEKMMKAEDEHTNTINHVLQRVLNIRQYLWT